MNRLYLFFLAAAILSAGCERRIKDSVKHIRFNPYPGEHQIVWAPMGEVSAQFQPTGSVQLAFGDSIAVTLQADFLSPDSLDIEFFAGYFRLETGDARLHVCADREIVWLHAESGSSIEFTFSRPLAPITSKAYQFEFKGDTGNRVYLHSSQPFHIDSQRIHYNGRELVLAFSTSAELDENPSAPQFFEQKFLDTFQTWNWTFAEFDLEWQDNQSRGPFYTDAYLALRPNRAVSAESAFEFILKQAASNSAAAESAREALAMLGLTVDGETVRFKRPEIQSAHLRTPKPLVLHSRGAGNELKSVTLNGSPVNVISASRLLNGGELIFQH